MGEYSSDDLRTIEILYVAGAVLLIFGVLKLARIQTMLSTLFNQKMKRNVELGDLPIRKVFLTDKEDHMLNLRIYKESCLVYN